MVLSEKQVVDRLSEWISADVKKKQIKDVLWAMAMANIDASVMNIIKVKRREHREERARLY